MKFNVDRKTEIFAFYFLEIRSELTKNKKAAQKWSYSTVGDRHNKIQIHEMKRDRELIFFFQQTYWRKGDEHEHYSPKMKERMEKSYF